MDAKQWIQPGIFYILNINGITKFGITQNFENRMKMYFNQYRRNRTPFNYTIHYQEEYESFWQLEFIETMLRRRLYPWVSLGSLEYIKSEVPTQNVINCYHEIKKSLTDYNSFEHVKEYHKIGKLRYKLYKLYYLERKATFEAIEVLNRED